MPCVDVDVSFFLFKQDLRLEMQQKKVHFLSSELT